MIGAIAVRPGSQECTCHWPAICDGTGWKQCQDDCDCRCGGMWECLGCTACRLKPYYEHDGFVIYHGDCREILPQLAPVDLVLTDPPYGIAHPTDYKSRGRGRLAPTSDFASVFGDDKQFDPHIWASMPAILWGANYYSDCLPASSGWLLWDKRVQEGKGVNDQADGEMAWSNFVKGVRIFRHMWNGFWRDSERGESYHPTQKPVALMAWCMSLPWTPQGIILDPFMGSGTTLVAAKRLGRRAIGIEIEERYCEIAAQRLEAERLTLFEYAGIVPTQLKLEGVA